MPPRYERVADALRALIMAGTLPPGATVPSAAALAREHDVGRDTALKGIAVLRREGLLFLAPDKSIRVGPVTARPARRPLSTPDEVLPVPPGGVVSARMPTRRERERFNLADGVPVLVVHTADGEELHPGDRFAVRWH
ncbi:GntR family transcriptional regulator [Dactylosporangium aurantiacum]|uniref:GntR family transcriptional regulator n=1 Tax=Dactylosporangium aurantiacum TaxID=35754 RepID=A0A9Q9IC89_9ACTN|nr:winged helix-turn-helix domain-containing protein [Dactylosporangium aurantiacum]MDG6102630.1 winged helix-turn-helix domain-containing protein [Dactylosporangium aurantiacum]UWZ53116.1 GntR family transcriptional regulator [Dactylosporangium aurantiacum]